MSYQSVEEAYARCRKDGIEFWKAIQLEDMDENGITEEDSWRRMIGMWQAMLDGIAAIEYKRELYATVNGEVTPERVSDALETYQNLVNKYGPIEREFFPLLVNIEQIVPIRPLLKALP